MIRSTAHAIARTLAAASLLAGVGCAAAQSPVIPGWRLVWTDDFNGAVLDPSRWFAENTAWPYNNELEFYQPGQATVGNSLLNILAEHRTVGGRQYVSARIDTHGHFAQQYGRFEARMMLPAGAGYWPAFWLLPASLGWPPELDIMEAIGSQPNNVLLTQHWGTDFASHQYAGVTYTGPNYTTGYHRFAIEWSPTRIDWLVDGVVRYSSTTNIPQEPMYVLLNLAVGGDLGGTPNPAAFPKSMLVDWVRVYQRDSALLNASFETAGTSTPLASWQSFGNTAQTTTLPHSGTKSVRAFGSAGAGPVYSGVYQDLPASPGQVWSASAFASHTAATRLIPGNQAFVKIEWNNAQNQMISSQQTLALSDTSPLNTPIQTTLQATAPAGTAYARLTLILVQTGTGSGSVYFDDAAFGYSSPAAVSACPADFNGTGGVSTLDIFAFLNAWFGADPRADFNQIDGLTLQDVFDFLNTWFQGCP